MQPILITGCPRSGTSATAGVFSHLGAFGGNMRGAFPHNPRGQFENKALVRLNKKWLVANGYDNLGQRPVPGPEDCLDLSEEEIHLWRERVIDILVDEGWDGKSPWMFKDAKMVWNGHLWSNAFPEAIWVTTVRNVFDNARSCMKTHFMTRYNTLEQWVEYCVANYRRMDAVIPFPHEVRPARFIHQSPQQLIRVAESAGLEWDQEAVLQFLNTHLFSGEDDGSRVDSDLAMEDVDASTPYIISHKGGGWYEIIDPGTGEAVSEEVLRHADAEKVLEEFNG